MNRFPASALVVFHLFLISVSLSAQQGTFDQYLDHPWVDSVLATLSPEQKAGQSLWVRTGPDTGLPQLMEIARLAGESGLGGLIFPVYPGERMKELADYCRSLGSLSPVIALEGGWEGHFPSMTSLAAIESDSVRYLAGTVLAGQLREKGISLVLAGGMDDALAAGLARGQVGVLDPTRIQSADIDFTGGFRNARAHADTLDRGARQVLALKYRLRQMHAGAAEVEAVKTGAGNPGNAAFIRDLYARSLTVLINREDLIPLRDLDKISIACLAVNKKDLTDFQRMAAMYSRTDNYFWSPEENKEALIEQLAAYDLVLAGLYPGHLGKEAEALFSSLAGKTKLVVTWFGVPAGPEGAGALISGAGNPVPEGLILTYEQNPFTEELSAQLIFGGIGAGGRLPVSIGDHFPGGYGIHTPGGLRLQYGFPENAGLSSGILYPRIDSIVNRGLEAGAYPGCQVIVARKGTVVFHKAYGFHTYDKRIEVRKNDLYDLASVTKISGPLSGLMYLEGLGKFSYQDRLGDYCRDMKGSDKADLALKDILTHRAGLFPWIPYHELALKRNGHYKKRFIHPDAEGKYSLQVADRLYLSNTFRKKILKEIRKSELGEQEYLYSGLAFFLFPTVIEELSGKPYETFLAENIYHRLGAWELLYHPRSAYPGSRIVPTEYDSVFRKQLVHGYVHDEGAALMGSHAGNAGLFASSNDLLKLMEMYRRMGSYGGEQIIREEVLREYSSYQFPELKNRRGLGFDKPLLNEQDGTPEDYPCPGASASSFGHSGFTGTFVWADPEHEISYVFLCNRVYPTRLNGLLYDMDIRTSILQSVYDSILEP